MTRIRAAYIDEDTDKLDESLLPASAVTADDLTDALVGARRYLITEFGLVADGATNETSALNAAFAQMRPGDVLTTSPSGTSLSFRHAGILTIAADKGGWTLDSAVSLIATAPGTATLRVLADDMTIAAAVTVLNVTTREPDETSQAAVCAKDCSNFAFTGSVTNAAGAGVVLWNVQGGLVTGTVTNTEADGIHLICGTSDVRVLRPTVTGTNDDAISIVSYTDKGGTAYGPCSRNIIVEPVISGQNAKRIARSTTGGRGIAILGGTANIVTGPSVTQSASSGFYVGALDTADYTTHPAIGNVLEGGTFVDCVKNRPGSSGQTGIAQDHAVVHVESSLPDKVSVADTTLRGFTIYGSLVVAGTWGAVAPNLHRVDDVTIRNTRVSEWTVIDPDFAGTVTDSGIPSSAFPGTFPPSEYRAERGQVKLAADSLADDITAIPDSGTAGSAGVTPDDVTAITDPLYVGIGQAVTFDDTGLDADGNGSIVIRDEDDTVILTIAGVVSRTLIAGAAGEPPGQLMGLTAEPGSAEGEVDLEWTTLADATAYQYRTAPTGTTTWSAWMSAGTGTSFTITGLTPDDILDVQARGFNGGGFGDPSTTAGPVTVADGAPDSWSYVFADYSEGTLPAGITNRNLANPIKVSSSGRFSSSSGIQELDNPAAGDKLKGAAAGTLTYAQGGSVPMQFRLPATLGTGKYWQTDADGGLDFMNFDGTVDQHYAKALNHDLEEPAGLFKERIVEQLDGSFVLQIKNTGGWVTSVSVPVEDPNSQVGVGNLRCALITPGPAPDYGFGVWSWTPSVSTS